MGKREIQLTLVTADGCTGKAVLGEPGRQRAAWDREPEAHTVKVTMALVEDGQVIEESELDGDEWRDFESDGHEARFVRNVRAGISLADALAACV